MLVAALENFVLFSSFLAVSGFFMVWAARQATRSRRGHLHPQRLAGVYTGALTLPPLVAAWLVAAALLPELFLGEAAFRMAHPTPLHSVHLLGDLTAPLQPGFRYLALSWLAPAAVAGAWSGLSGYCRGARAIESLQRDVRPTSPEHLVLLETVSERYGLHVGIIQTDYPLCFVWGFRRSKLVVSSGLLGMLTLEELRGVLEHEAVHHARRDNLGKLALSLFAYASVASPLMRLVLRWRAEQVELMCDEVAAARTASPLDIAGALVKVRRWTLASVPGAPLGNLTSPFLETEPHDLERRVRRLVALADALPTPPEALNLSRSLRGAAIAAATVFVSALAIASAFAPLAVHDAVEFLIRSLN